MAKAAQGLVQRLVQRGPELFGGEGRQGGTGQRGGNGLRGAGERHGLS